MISCILYCYIKFLINVKFVYVGFEKCDLCIYLEFVNDFKNDMLGNARFDNLVYSKQDELDKVHGKRPKNRTGGR